MNSILQLPQAEIARLQETHQAKIQQRDLVILEKTTKLEQHISTVQQQSIQLREKDEKIQQKDTQLQERNADISGLQRELQVGSITSMVNFCTTDTPTSIKN